MIIVKFVARVFQDFVVFEIFKIIKISISFYSLLDNSYITVASLAS